jgi:hypothetical protein
VAPVTLNKSIPEEPTVYTHSAGKSAIRERRRLKSLKREKSSQQKQIRQRNKYRAHNLDAQIYGTRCKKGVCVCVLRGQGGWLISSKVALEPRQEMG